MALQKQPRLGKFLDSAYDFGSNNKNKKWFKEAISEMGLKEKWITKDQSNNRLVKILLFFGVLLLIMSNILLFKCYKNSLEMKKPNWIINNDKGSVLIHSNHSRDRGVTYNFSQARLPYPWQKIQVRLGLVFTFISYLFFRHGFTSKICKPQFSHCFSEWLSLGHII